jgi:hypothetical protein
MRGESGEGVDVLEMAGTKKKFWEWWCGEV